MPNVSSAAEFLSEQLGDQPRPQVGIILGSGLGGLADQITDPLKTDPLKIDYESIPGFVRSTAGGHRGQMIFGTLQSVPVVAMAGRFHRYEGWTNDQAAFPVEVMHAIGVSSLIVSNAAGGVSPKLAVGDIVILKDHLNWMGGTFGFNRNLSSEASNGSGEASNGSCEASNGYSEADVFGGPDRGNTYDTDMAHAAQASAMQAGFTANFGTYLATLGPTYETRAEYRMMRQVGADVVGMSTVPEVLVAKSLGLRVLGLSMVSNVADPDRPIVADHEEVLMAGKAAGAKMETIVRGVLSTL